MVVIAAGRDESGTGAHALHQLKSEHTAIKTKRTIEVGDLEVNMPDARSRDDGRVFRHICSMGDGARYDLGSEPVSHKLGDFAVRQPELERVQRHRNHGVVATQADDLDNAALADHLDRFIVEALGYAMALVQ
jgi:hypothetical protein